MAWADPARLIVFHGPPRSPGPAALLFIPIPHSESRILEPEFPLPACCGEKGPEAVVNRVILVKEIKPVLPGRPSADDSHFFQFLEFPDDAFYVGSRIPGNQPRIQGFFGVFEKERKRPVQRWG